MPRAPPAVARCWQQVGGWCLAPAHATGVRRISFLAEFAAVGRGEPAGLCNYPTGSLAAPAQVWKWHKMDAPRCLLFFGKTQASATMRSQCFATLAHPVDRFD